jgi:hypothetical protein
LDFRIGHGSFNVLLLGLNYNTIHNTSYKHLQCDSFRGLFRRFNTRLLLGS